MELADLERLDRLEREGEALTMAERIAMAFHEPKRLQQERQAFAVRANLQGPAQDAFTAAQRIDATLKRLGRGTTRPST